MNRIPHRSVRMLWLGLLLVGLALATQAVHALSGTRACNPAVLTRLSVAPDRPHRLAAGASTTFVFRLFNPGVTEDSGDIVVGEVPADWSAALAYGNVSFQPIGPGAEILPVSALAPGESRLIVLSVSAPADAGEGATADVAIEATLDNGLIGCGTGAAVVSSRPKVYLLGIDGLPWGYVKLGQDGRPDPAPDAPLMPYLRAFRADSASFPAARASLVSATDPNVFGLLSGSWPGTAGVDKVGIYFYGWDEDDQPIMRFRSAEELRYGPEGERVLSIFDVAHDPAFGGEADLFTAFATGKWQPANLVDGHDAPIPNILVTGESYPYYVAAPQPYVLGDPASDANRETDRDGTNVFPPSEFHLHLQGVGLYGDSPAKHPSDEWVMWSAMRILAAEDPDVFAVFLGNVDEIHHAAGSAVVPAEWGDRGTPDILWDDVNFYNSKANREPVLDVVHEADAQIGRFLDALAQRQALDAAFVTLFSDHSGNTLTTKDLDLAQILADGGLGDKVHMSGGFCEVAMVYLYDPDDAAEVAAYLENWSTWHPAYNTTVNPLAAITREEMATSVDSVLGPFGRTGGPGRAELYSEWLIEHPVDDNSQVIWPDIAVFTRYRMQFAPPDMYPNVVGGHGGMGAIPVMLALRGPGIQNGVHSVEDTSLVDVMPTLYHLLGWENPGNVDGRILNEILIEP